MESKYRRRLNKLADLLDADAANKKGIRFNLGLLANVSSVEAPISCGTQACALGLAALSGKFKKAGMRVDHFNASGGNTISIGHDNGSRVTWDWHHTAKAVFGLSYGQVDWLFTSGAYRGNQGASTERKVAERLRKVAAGTAKMPTKYTKHTW